MAVPEALPEHGSGAEWYVLEAGDPATVVAGPLDRPAAASARAVHDAPAELLHRARLIHQVRTEDRRITFAERATVPPQLAAAEVESEVSDGG
jgi:hypothetical protein